jgi:hypothetical protein
MRAALDGAGDRTRERIFRTNITVCLHRAMTEEECSAMPASVWEGEAEGIVGAPVEVLWENVPGGLSTKPCAHPIKQRIPGMDHDAYGWIPIDCGHCPSCRAREAARSKPANA